MTERIQIVDLFSHDGKIENHITKTTRMTLSQGPTALFKSVKPLFEFVPNCAHSQMSATEKCLITFIKIDALWFLYVTSFCLFSVQFFLCLSRHNTVFMVGKSSWLFGHLINSWKCPQVSLKKNLTILCPLTTGAGDGPPPPAKQLPLVDTRRAGKSAHRPLGSLVARNYTNTIPCYVW